jgi:hypothetical protein
MKKSILLVAVAFCICTGAMAQGVSGGIKAGLNFANMNFESDGGDFSPDNRTSFHVGLFATLMVSESFGVQPEVLYNSIGAKYEVPIAGGESIYKLNYISIPIMLRYNPAKVFNIHAGPQFGLLLSAKEEFDGDSDDIKDGLKGLDLGLGLGIGLDLPMGLTASARYTLGLSNINDGDDDEGKVKNNVIQLSVGYKLFGAGD